MLGGVKLERSRHVSVLSCGSLSAFRIIQPRLAESSAKRPAMIQEVTSLRRPVNVASGTSQQDVPRTNRNPPT
ncbi:hypothetical protein V1477_009183 [Vespula maculifrons]|uniref:Uncharacterized protein n=1 Tax=Vespula maculifrons TaxID=7453 RepID=A0ABD2CC04_VESMC